MLWEFNDWVGPYCQIHLSLRRMMQKSSSRTPLPAGFGGGKDQILRLTSIAAGHDTQHAKRGLFLEFDRRFRVMMNLTICVTE
jgi:hypothetical protein